MFKKLLGLIMYYSTCPYSIQNSHKRNQSSLQPNVRANDHSLAPHTTLACSERVAKDKFVQSTT